MKKELVAKLRQNFEAVVNHQEKTEFWYGRDLQFLLGYSEWRNFLQVIDKAKQACINSKQKISDHFVDVNKMVTLGSDSLREVELNLKTKNCKLNRQIEK